MQVMALKDQWLNGVRVRAGAVMAVSKAHGAKLIREGLAKERVPPAKKLETKP
jgi:hypothetical protein